MYTRLKDLTPEAIEAFLKLKDEVKFTTATGSRVRVGKNKQHALSIYDYSKWFNWTHGQRELVREHLGETLTRKARQLHFLNLPAKTGFLDIMDAWVGKGASCGKMAAYCLGESQTIYIDNRAVKLSRGEGIYFCLANLHHINASKDGQLWLCTMTRQPLSELI